MRGTAQLTFREQNESVVLCVLSLRSREHTTHFRLGLATRTDSKGGCSPSRMCRFCLLQAHGSQWQLRFFPRRTQTMGFGGPSGKDVLSSSSLVRPDDLVHIDPCNPLNIHSRLPSPVLGLHELRVRPADLPKSQHLPVPTRRENCRRN